MKATLTALTIAATMFASSVSAADPAHLQQLKDTDDCAMCDLSGADLRKANLSYADLSYANLVGTNLEGANLRMAKLDFVIMNGAILCNTTMPDGYVIYSGC